MDIQKTCKEELATLNDETKRLVNPTIIPVDLTDKLYALKMELLKKSKQDS